MSFSINSNTKLKLNGSYSLNISNLDPFATPETNVFIVNAKHEDDELLAQMFSHLAKTFKILHKWMLNISFGCYYERHMESMLTQQKTTKLYQIF